MSEANCTTIRAIYASIRARDADGYRALVHPKFTVRQPGFLPYGGDHKGVDAALAMFREVLKVVDVNRLSVTALTAAGEDVWAEITVHARSDG